MKRDGIASQLALPEPSEDHPLWRALLAWPTNPGLALLRALEARAIRTVELQTPILDIGCGDGRFGTLLSPAPDIGVDYDTPRCVSAQRSGVYRAVLRSDVRLLPIESGSCGSVIANSVFEHLEAWQKAIHECYRVLAPGGRLAITGPCAAKRNLLFFANRAIYDNGEDAERYRTFFDKRWGHRAYIDVDEWSSVLEQTGFKTVTATAYEGQATALTDILLNVRLRYVEWSLDQGVVASQVWARLLFKALEPYYDADLGSVATGMLLVAEKD